MNGRGEALVGAGQALRRQGERNEWSTPKLGEQDHVLGEGQQVDLAIEDLADRAALNAELRGNLLLLNARVLRHMRIDVLAVLAEQPLLFQRVRVQCEVVRSSEIEAETDVCAEVVLSADEAERRLDVLDAVKPDVGRGWCGKEQHSDARCCAKGSAENVSAMSAACPCPYLGRAYSDCCRCRWCCWEDVGGREPCGAG